MEMDLMGYHVPWRWSVGTIKAINLSEPVYTPRDKIYHTVVYMRLRYLSGVLRSGDLFPDGLHDIKVSRCKKNYYFV